MDVKWIPVETSLPEEKRNVLVTDGTEIAMLYREFRHDRKTWYWSMPDWISGMEADIDFDDKKITHWMELPPLPTNVELKS